MAIRNKEVRAIEYRRLALAASELGEASVLDHVREKHAVAAARWVRLAEIEELPSTIPLKSA